MHNNVSISESLNNVRLSVLIHTRQFPNNISDIAQKTNKQTNAVFLDTYSRAEWKKPQKITGMVGFLNHQPNLSCFNIPRATSSFHIFYFVLTDIVAQHQ